MHIALIVCNVARAAASLHAAMYRDEEPRASRLSSSRSERPLACARGAADRIPRRNTRCVLCSQIAVHGTLSFYFSFLSTVPPRPAPHLGVAAIGARKPTRFGGGSGHVPSVEPSAGSVRYNPAQRGLSWPLSLLS